jgi:hypothetical protein
MVKAWLYMSRGRRVGPVGEESLLNLRRDGSIDDDTPVWSPEEQADHPDWRPLSAAEIKPASRPAGARPPGPPPAPLSSISNVYAWLIVLGPLALAAIDFASLARTGKTAPFALTVIAALVLYGALALLDAQEIESGHVGKAQRLSAWWIMLVPIYLWRRGTILNKVMSTYGFGRPWSSSASSSPKASSPILSWRRRVACPIAEAKSFNGAFRTPLKTWLRTG